MPITGTPKTVRTFTRADLVQYMQRAYTTDNMLLVAAGNVSHRQMLALAEKFVPKRRASSPPQRQLYSHQAYKPFVKEKVKPISQAHLMMGFPLP